MSVASEGRPPAALAAGLSLGLAVLGGFAAAWAGPEPSHPPVPLRCQLEGGPWQDCRMIVESLGERWSLAVGPDEVRFEHDGRGHVRMQRRGSDWVPVDAHWTADAALCWDGVCAKGDLPLD